MTKEHHFTVCAGHNDEGRIQFYISDTTICDPDKPVWDTETEMWSRVLDEDKEMDDEMFVILSNALLIANETIRKASKGK